MATLLAIDIGNTAIAFGIFKQDRLLKRYSLTTIQTHRYKDVLKKIFSRHRIEDSVICSVVPWAEELLEKEIVKMFRKRPLSIGRDLIVPIKNRYRKPWQVGQDRLVNSYAALTFYGSPAVIIDFGTAVTFDVVSARKEYRGGMILAGLGISLEALAHKTALLPKISLAKPKEFIGRDTRSSMLSGLFYGMGALTDDLSRRIRLRIGNKAKIIGTGGNITLVAEFCNSLQIIDQDLTLKGINLLYRSR